MSEVGSDLVLAFMSITIRTPHPHVKYFVVEIIFNYYIFVLFKVF